MRKVIVFLGAVLLVALVIAAVVPKESNQNNELLRIHIRANSNGGADQEIKYAVRDAIVDLLNPLLSGCTSKEEAEAKLQVNLPLVERTADGVLKASGFGYRSKASLTNEFFPDRVYEDIVVESGYYDALILCLGEAKGDNWWCVVYPPLCFLGSSGEGGVQYKSAIKEWIKSLQEGG